MLQNDNVLPDLRRQVCGQSRFFLRSDYDWTGGFFKNCLDNVDIMAEHWYANGGHHWDVEKGKALAPDKPSDDAYVKIDQTLLESARYAGRHRPPEGRGVAGIPEAFPAIVEKKIPLSIDEYAYFGGSMEGENPFGGENLKAVPDLCADPQRDAALHRFPDHGSPDLGHRAYRINRTARR